MEGGARQGLGGHLVCFAWPSPGLLTLPLLPCPSPFPQALDGGLTAASLATPEGEALVARCLLLHEQLTALSQLKPPKGSPLVPLVRRVGQDCASLHVH